MENKKNLKVLIISIIAALLAICALAIGLLGLNKQSPEAISLQDAYNNSVDNGYEGTMTDWLSSIDEKFSYETIVNNGYKGSMDQWYTDLINTINNYLEEKPEPLTYGITNVQVIDENLVFTFSDGSSINVGSFGQPGESGAAGAPGPAGKDGSSIADLTSVDLVDLGSNTYQLKFTWTNDEDGNPREFTTSNTFTISGSSIDVIDNLTTDDATKALSAKQGKVLNDNKLNKNLGTSNSGKILKVGATGEVEFADASSVGANINIAKNLTTDNDDWVLSAKQGKILNDSKLNISGYTDKKGKYLYIDNDGKVGFTDPTNVTVDSDLSDSSTNPVQNKIIKTALDDKVNISQGADKSGKILKVDSSGNLVLANPTGTDIIDNLSSTRTDAALSANQGKYLGDTLNVANYASNKEKYLYLDSNGKVTFKAASDVISIDSVLSSTSTNPVENKAINSALTDKVDKKGYADADKGKYLYINDSKEVALGTIPDSLPALTNANDYLRVNSGKTSSEWVTPVDDATKISNTGLANNFVTAGAINTALNGKVNLNQGTDKKDQILQVNASGILALADLPEGTTYTSGTGITIGTGNVINHTNSVTAETTGIGGATAAPTIKYDAQGHITSVTTSNIYPPTSVGNNYQYWMSDGDGVGAWTTAITSLASALTTDVQKATLVTAGAVETALSGKVDKFQGADNKNKILKVNDSGNLELVAAYTAADGIKIDTGNVIKHTNSVTAATKGATVNTTTNEEKYPIITFDAQGHITSVSEQSIYAPTSIGGESQYWGIETSIADASNLEERTYSVKWCQAINELDDFHKTKSDYGSDDSGKRERELNRTKLVTAGAIHDALDEKIDRYFGTENYFRPEYPNTNEKAEVTAPGTILKVNEDGYFEAARLYNCSFYLRIKEDAEIKPKYISINELKDGILSGSIVIDNILTFDIPDNLARHDAITNIFDYLQYFYNPTSNGFNNEFFDVNDDENYNYIPYLVPCTGIICIHVDSDYHYFSVVGLSYTFIDMYNEYITIICQAFESDLSTKPVYFDIKLNDFTNIDFSHNKVEYKIYPDWLHDEGIWGDQQYNIYN